MGHNNKALDQLGQFLRTMCDLMLLNLLWIICSLPIITAGASTCALFYVELKMARDESSEPLHEFFSAFKTNFKNSTVFGLIALLAAGILYVDYSFAFAQSGSFRIFFFVVCGIVSAIWLTFVSYVFALQARYDNSVRGQIRNSFLLAFCAPLKTILMWIIYAVPVALIVLLPFDAVAYIGFIFLLVGISAPVYFTSKILRKVFDIFSKDKNNNEQRICEETC